MEDKRYKILLVEDDRLDQMAFKRLVKEECLPYDYTIAGSVAQATQILGGEKFDLVFVDYLLGDGTAFDVLESIVDTAAVFATGTGSEELAVKAMKSGASDYLIKDPSRNYLKVLPEVVKNAIRHKKAEDELKQYHEKLVELVKERTEQLAEEKEVLAVTLSSMGDAVIAVDAQNRITLFNKTAEQLTGWRFEEVRGKPVDEIIRIVNEQTKQPANSPIDSVLESREIESGSDHDALIARTGRERPISATAAPIRRNDGTMTGIVMVLRDVAQQREIDRMKSDFISSVSHELRTPLTSIKAYAETMLDDPNMPQSTRQEFLQIIDEESDRLTNLINGILDISKIESGTIEIIRKPINIASVAKRAAESLEYVAGKKKVRLQTDIAGHLPELLGDENKIYSMLTNLINNAIKFTPENGTASVSAHFVNNELVVKVSDTGMGIPKDDLNKIFGRFYRVHRPGKQIQGTGLGLAIVKEIVMRHDGRINVESEIDKGSTFTVYLPVAQQPAHAATR
ncbi:MAG: ATP-binding protein [Sedimentisphaerales bacterium]|jgi:PAS domain S-box-containing protein